MSTTASASGSSVTVGESADALSTNSVGPLDRTSRGGTGRSCSSLRRRPSRLVTSTVTLSVASRILPMMSAAASRTCSQLSNSSSRTRPSNADATLSATLSPGCWLRPRTAATASGTAAGSVTGPSSIIHTPSGNSGCRRAATSCARRVLPTPPTPVRVTRRCDFNAVATSATSDSRPTKLVAGGRRLPWLVSSVLRGGNSDRSPSATTWKTSTGLAMSRRRRGPRATRSTPETRSAVIRSIRSWPPWPAAISRAVRLHTAPK